jgi:hypothetical protein
MKIEHIIEDTFLFLHTKFHKNVLSLSTMYMFEASTRQFPYFYSNMGLVF